MPGPRIGIWIGRLARARWLAVVMVLAHIALSAGADAAETARWFNLPAQPLAKALIQFGLQADLSIGYRGLDFHGQKSLALVGYDTPQSALSRILKDSDFSFEIVDAETIRIVKRGPKPAPARTPAPVKVATPSPPKTDTSDWIGEILVTVTKRPEELQAIPYSAVAITGDDLTDAGASTTRALTSMVAGVTATDVGVGRDKFAIRGLSDSAFSGHTQSTVGLYLDETRVTFNAPDPGLQLVDIDRIEVVRGPQGTLYGAGSIGGLIRIITNKPVLDRFQAFASGELATTESGGPTEATQAMVNIPLVTDKFGLRIVGYGRHNGGYIDDIRLGTKNINRTNIAGGRLTARWDIGSRWSVQSATTYQSIVARDTQYYDASLAPLTRANYVAEPHDNDFFDTSVLINAELPWATLVSSTAYVRQSVHSRYDASLAIPAILGLPVTTSPFDEYSLYRTIDHETRLSSAPGKRFHWLLGGFISHRDDEYDTDLSLPLAGGDLESAYSEHRTDNGDEFALFGEITYDLTDKWSLTAGLRSFHWTLTVTSQTDGTANIQPASVNGVNRKNGVTPKAVISFKPKPDVLIYALASKGFRLGGVNVDSPISTGSGEPDEHGATVSNFASDTLYNFELGAKTAWFNHRLIANGAIYYTIWNNIQSDQIRPTGFIYTINAGDAIDYGLELDITARPIDSLELHGSLFLNNADLSSLLPSLGASNDGRLPGAPAVAFGLSATYNLDFGNGWLGTVSGDFSWTGHSQLVFQHQTNPLVARRYRIGNLRFSLSRGHWHLGLYVDNVANDRSNIFPFGNPFSARDVTQSQTGFFQKTPPRPRTFGVRFGWTY